MASGRKLLWLTLVTVGLGLSVAFAVNAIGLSYFFVAEGIIITLAAGLRRRGW